MDKCRTIELPNGALALVDADDFERVNKFHWCISSVKHLQYAHRRSHNDESIDTKTVKMHRFILGLHGKKFQHISVDHINGNGLDNRKSNLRRADMSQNLANIHTRHSKHIFKGVSYSSRKKHCQWRARIRKDNKLIDLGHYPTVELAAAAYDGAAKALYGEFANGNFFT